MQIFDPLHYLPLLEQRPGAFHHAKPLRRWREEWPPVYEELLARLQTEQPDGVGIRTFVRILKLHQAYPATLLEQAVAQALRYGTLHADGVLLCLHQLNPPVPQPTLDLTMQPHLHQVGNQTVNLSQYNQLLEGVHVA